MGYIRKDKVGSLLILVLLVSNIALLIHQRVQYNPTWTIWKFIGV